MTGYVQVCETETGPCSWVPVESLTAFPELSIQDSLTLSSAVFGLFAVAWVYRKLQAAI